MRKIFLYFDKNGDGMISMSEIEKELTKSPEKGQINIVNERNGC